MESSRASQSRTGQSEEAKACMAVVVYHHQQDYGVIDILVVASIGKVLKQRNSVLQIQVTTSHHIVQVFDE